MALLELQPLWMRRMSGAGEVPSTQASAPAHPAERQARVGAAASALSLVCDWQFERPTLYAQITSLLWVTPGGGRAAARQVIAEESETARLVFKLPPLASLQTAAERRALFEEILVLRKRLRQQTER